MGASCSGAECVSFGRRVLKRLDCLTPRSQSAGRPPQARRRRAGQSMRADAHRLTRGDGHGGGDGCGAGGGAGAAGAAGAGGGEAGRRWSAQMRAPRYRYRQVQVYAAPQGVPPTAIANCPPRSFSRLAHVVGVGAGAGLRVLLGDPNLAPGAHCPWLVWLCLCLWLYLWLYLYLWRAGTDCFHRSQKRPNKPQPTRPTLALTLCIPNRRRPASPLSQPLLSHAANHPGTTLDRMPQSSLAPV